MAISMGVPYEVYQSDRALPEADVYVDAILGTGSRPGLSPLLAELVERVNQTKSIVISIDIPTGVDADTGEVPGPAIRASRTVSIGVQKLGTAITPGALYAGEVSVVDIGLDTGFLHPVAECLNAQDVAQRLPERGALTHKGSYGRVGVIAGEMIGAAVLAGQGAMRSGAGLVVLTHPHESPVPAPYEFVQRCTSPERPLESVHECHAIVVGPGLGELYKPLVPWLSRHPGPGVLDADGLRVFEIEGFAGLSEGRWVLTPHPKECARLIGWTVDEVQARRLAAAKAAAQKTRSVVILKGYRSIICAPDGRVRVNLTGDASLATAGTGDVLAGIVGGLLAQGLDPFDAASVGAFIHGLAGELAGKARSKVSAVASDVVENISRAISLCFDAIPGD
jgi:NAD(P)H-hydrate epimerase